MAEPPKRTGRRVVLSPAEPLVAGGPAEEFEQRVQKLFQDGFRDLVVDLSGVTRVDSLGVRALVRGFTTAQRLGGSFRLAAPNEQVRTVLKIAHLDHVLTICDSLEEARARRWPWAGIRLVVSAGLLAAALVWGGPAMQRASSGPTPGAFWTGGLIEVVKLIAAAAIGVLVSAVHRGYRREKPLSLSMEQAQVLLCVSGALMMIIIGDSLARAFGLMGAAAIVRFRTPVEDPKDITILLLVMLLGMSAGLGALPVAGLGALFLCALLVVLDRLGVPRARSMMLEVESESREFPVSHVEEVFARHRVLFELREVSQGKTAVARYHATLEPQQSLDELSGALLAHGTAGIKAVSWEPPKRTD